MKKLLLALALFLAVNSTLKINAITFNRGILGIVPVIGACNSIAAVKCTLGLTFAQLILYPQVSSKARKELLKYSLPAFLVLTALTSGLIYATKCCYNKTVEKD